MSDKHLQKIINKLIENSFQDGKLLESQVAKSIKLLKLLPRYKSIQALTEYLKQLKREMRKYTVLIETTVPLSSSQIKKIKTIVEKKHKITKVITKISPEILGGFKLKVGDEIWDESMLGKVNQIKEEIVRGRLN